MKLLSRASIKNASEMQGLIDLFVHLFKCSFRICVDFYDFEVSSNCMC